MKMCKALVHSHTHTKLTIVILIMLLGKKPCSLVETSVDVFAPAPDVNEEGEFSISDHFGEGKAFPGGPVCEFRGNKIPTLVQWSEHGDNW